MKQLVLESIIRLLDKQFGDPMYQPSRRDGQVLVAEIERLRKEVEWQQQEAVSRTTSGFRAGKRHVPR